MRLKPYTRMYLEKVGTIVLAFICIGIFFTYYNHAFIHSSYSQGPTVLYNVKVNLLANLLIGLIAGVLGGSLLIWVNGSYFRKKSFGFALFTTLAFYVLTFVLVTLSVALVVASIQGGWEKGLGGLIDQALEYILSPMLGVYFFMWCMITLFSLFLLQVNDKFGPGILKKFLLGKYHNPREVDRVFMFLDMRSSTSIAEKLGNTAYFNLLYDAFSDITEAILQFDGEIYQYVGDEIVVSWGLKKGKHKANCIACFYGIQHKLSNRSQSYLDKYGVAPEFKAGLHLGRVTAGEIGIIKRDIVYSGDVLNTTSRIQEQCNAYQQNLLVSQEVLDWISPLGEYNFQLLGTLTLRGKEEYVKIHGVNLVST